MLVYRIQREWYTRSMNNRYELRPQLSAEELLAYGSVHPLTAQLLANRNIHAEKARAFLEPHYEMHTHDPLLLKDASRAAERIIRAIENKEKIVIYTDYDTDGIPGGAMFADFFGRIGYTNFINYIPHRHNEGFGFHVHTIKEFAEQGVKLIITIDCGITDVDATAAAHTQGIDVIITDHHLPHGEIPQAYAIVNPQQESCQYPEKNLCGTGVAFKLIQAILKVRTEQKLEHIFIWKEGHEKWLLDLVAIATLSDMVPLVGENRVLAKYGLKVLRKTPRLGLKNIFTQAGTPLIHATEDDIGFTLGPRINAASRMGVPMDAFTMLRATTEKEAKDSVAHLEKINAERKVAVAHIAKELKSVLSQRGVDLNNPPKVIVAGNPHWRPSLLGLVANTLVEETGSAVFLWGRDGEGFIKGSCRGNGELSIVELMENATPTPFLGFGGHAVSGGFTVDLEHVHMLEVLLKESYEKIMTRKQAINSVLGSEKVSYIDTTLNLETISWNTFAAVDALSPFGMGNAKPLFKISRVSPVEVRAFGKEKNHTELKFSHGRGTLNAISFFVKPEEWEKALGRALHTEIDLIAHLEKSAFRGRPELRLRIIDIL